MKRLVIGAAVAGGAALAFRHCRRMMHDHCRNLPTGCHSQ
jgi:hypothetical protein